MLWADLGINTIMKVNWRVAVISLLILLLLSTVSVLLIREGLGHSYARRYFELASENFKSGKYGQSLKYGLAGLQNALDGGLRWTLAKPHFMKAQIMLHEGKDLYSALDECELTRTIVGSTYDDEGKVDYLCWIIKAEINPDVLYNPLLPVPTKTPAP